MPEVLLPFYPEGTTYINSSIGVKNLEKEQKVVYFNSGGPIYQHDISDLKSFRYITSQMMDLKLVKQVEVIRTFKISAESAKRWLKKYRQDGASAFFSKPVTRKGGTILTPGVIQRIESLFRQEKTTSQISQELDINKSTIDKAVQEGRIIKPAQKKKT